MNAGWGKVQITTPLKTNPKANGALAARLVMEIRAQTIAHLHHPNLWTIATQIRKVNRTLAARPVKELSAQARVHLHRRHHLQTINAAGAYAEKLLMQRARSSLELR